MIEECSLSPGVTLRYCSDRRFKKGALSIQLLRPMCEGETAENALLPAVLLRGTRLHPDLQQITFRLDELYGAAVSCLVRRVGDIQTVGFYLSFLEDRFALPGDRILAPTLDFLRELLLDPATENGVFPLDFVESEKKNLISVIEAELNDKQRYATAKMLRSMCRGDSFAVPRLGTADKVAAITPESLWAHYQKILRTSRAQIFYVGSAPMEEVAELLRPIAEAIAQTPEAVPVQTGFSPVSEPAELTEQMDVQQGKLAMGFYTPITNRDPRFAAMMVANVIYGAGATSKLFLNVREKQSLCYYANSGYSATKGIVNVSCGVDPENFEAARTEILRQLSELAAGNITAGELRSAKQAAVSSLRSVPDSPGALEGYYAVSGLSGAERDIDGYIREVEAVTAEQAAAAAATVQLHTTFFLKGGASK